MDPTAPKDNSQNPPDEGTQPGSPVQPGQFVVSGEEGGTAQNQVPPNLNAQPPTSPQNLQDDLNSTVAAATGTNLAGQPPSFAQPPVDAPAPPSNFQQQPDPTPFNPQATTPPAQPNSNVPAPDGFNPNQQQPDGASKGKFKIIIITIALILLVSIAAGLVWFFVLNKSAKKPTTTTQNAPAEEVALPSPTPRTEGGFGQIPESTDETAPQDTGSSPTDVIPQ